mmetsp:Transcript_105383/g.187383  ORF Transcript_105383/g.187383 Transcript_105383/m.187383 type:complete len:260 (-) Transcript_105383:52-831(-)|eukprot:CAMPEP_0197650782 /NCGR_PEP_ID=MMETSP1338-20131121/31153_1 /TAXON_ID=43686 ORGANISM="Pelagodinium beii, Strain RCC1491" /NCGR_SAMPLE_ID=MMETSP1338 /ASSEMBLY_ACC=CAM_ASM_000754 /LENGTH=259 /DNA_ID=CAMNT_0043225259 /DNA_START=48 /DNA_END=827 /DNA_ORIENTATION=-
MAAGIAVPYDTLGLHTADLVNRQWPLRPGERTPREYTKNNDDYGTHVHCHATQSYSAPSIPAGTSKRMGAFYEKTGVSQHRTEPGFRDTKGMATLTEKPIQGYGTLRQTNRLPGAGHTILMSHPGATEPRAPNFTQSMHVAYPPAEVLTIRPGSGGGQSRRSRASNGSRRSQTNSMRSSARSGRSEASSVPSWARRTAEIQSSQPWNFESLPMYDRTNATYGKLHASHGAESYQMKPAGKSESGFIDPQQLIASLTRAE